MAALTVNTCKLALPTRVAARKTQARRAAVVVKAAAPVDAVRVQQKVGENRASASRTLSRKSSIYPFGREAFWGTTLASPRATTRAAPSGR